MLAVYPATVGHSTSQAMLMHAGKIRFGGKWEGGGGGVAPVMGNANNNYAVFKPAGASLCLGPIDTLYIRTPTYLGRLVR